MALLMCDALHSGEWCLHRSGIQDHGWLWSQRCGDEYRVHDPQERAADKWTRPVRAVFLQMATLRCRHDCQTKRWTDRAARRLLLQAEGALEPVAQDQHDGQALARLVWARRRLRCLHKNAKRQSLLAPLQIARRVAVTNTRAVGIRTKTPPSLSSIQCLGALMRFKCFLMPRGMAAGLRARPEQALCTQRGSRSERSTFCRSPLGVRRMRGPVLDVTVTALTRHPKSHARLQQNAPCARLLLRAILLTLPARTKGAS